VRLAIAIALCACGKSAERAPVGSASGSSAALGLRVVTRLPATSVLLPGPRRIAIDADGRWLETRGGEPQPVPATAAAVTRLRGELGELELHLGRDVIAIGGEEHHEQYLRLVEGAKAIAFDDAHVTQVVATAVHEVWSYQDKLRSRLAVVDASGVVTPLPELALAGKPITGVSPVSTKLCATPAIKDVAATHDSVVALVVECDPEAPVRLVTYRWPGTSNDPAATVQELASRRALGFEPAQLAVAPGVHAIAGVGDGEIHVLKIGSAPTRLPGTTLTALEIAADGAVWLLAGTLWRDGTAMPVRDPSGIEVVPRALSRDEHLGIVVLAGATDVAWLLAESR
jgi:hypothetical protein